MSDWQTCDCGNRYDADNYEMCYQCAKRKAEEEGRLCDCGNFKSPEYDTCYQCSHD